MHSRLLTKYSSIIEKHDNYLIIYDFSSYYILYSCFCQLEWFPGILYPQHPPKANNSGQFPDRSFLLSDCFQCNPGRILLCPFFAAAGSAADGGAVQLNLHFKPLIVVRAGLSDEHVSKGLILLLLDQFL